jgi:hypothetical protein
MSPVRHSRVPATSCHRVSIVVSAPHLAPHQFIFQVQSVFDMASAAGDADWTKRTPRPCAGSEGKGVTRVGILPRNSPNGTCPY